MNPSSWLMVSVGTASGPSGAPSGLNWPLPGTAITLMIIAAPAVVTSVSELKMPARSLAEWLRPPGTNVL